MGKATRRGIIAASAVVAGLVIAPSAMAVTPGSTASYTASTGNKSTFFRFASKNRVLTALYAAQNTTGWGNVAILASSTDYADALAAAPLAENLSAPILLANADGSLDSQVRSYLNGFDAVVIASGPGVISDGVKDSLNAAGVTTVRVAGVNRYETAAALAVYSIFTSTEDWSSGANFILADGLDFPDALSSGPAAAKKTNGILLLTAGSKGVPSFTAQFLAGAAVSWSPATITWLPSQLPGVSISFDWSNLGLDFNHQTVTVVGGAAKAAAEAGVLGNATEPVEYDKAIVGKDRYTTATLVADEYFGSGVTYYTIANGRDSAGAADAVVAGGWAANAGGPLLLTQPTNLPAVTKAYLVDAADNGDKFVVFGGTGTVTPDVNVELEQLFRW